MAQVIKDDDDTRLNPGESVNDEKFNDIARHSETDDLENSYNAPSADSSQEDENIKKLRDQENNVDGATNQSKGLDDLESNPGQSKGGSSGFANNFTGGSGKSKLILNSKTVRKYAPITGLIITVVGGGIGIMALLSPTFVIFQIMNTLGGMDKSTPALSVRTKLMLKLKADGIKNGFAVTDDSGSCGIKCKFGTVSKSMISKMEKNGFKVTSDDTRIPGRSIIQEIQFPDTVDSSGKRIPGEKATNGKAFTELLKDPVRGALFNKVFNPAIAFKMNAKFSDILGRLKLGKGPQTKGATEADIEASERKNLGLPEEEGGTAAEPGSDQDLENKVGSKASSAFKETISGINGRVGKATNLVGAVCAVYSASKYVVLADKLAKIAAFTTLAWTFLNGVGQIMAGDGTPALSSFLGDQATQTDNSPKNSDGSENSFYGQSLTDSTGYKMAAYNENPGKLSSGDAKFAITALGVVGLISTFASFLGGKAGSAQSQTLNAACSPGSQAATTVAICAAEAAAGTEVPVLGNLAGLGLCILENGVAAVASSFAIEKILPPVAEEVIKADAPQIAGIVGGSLGDAMYSGTSSILNKTDMGYGMAAATSSSEVAQYAIDTAPIEQQQEQIAVLEAQKTPFDIYNKYSFLGMMAQNLHLASFATSSFSSNLRNVASIIPLGFKSLLSNSFAASSTSGAAAVSSLYTNSGCGDPGLADVGLVADSLCNPTDVMDSATMSMDIGTAVDYMLGSNDIDQESGLAEPGSEYANYVTYCTNRAEPLGEGGSLGDDNYMWEIGANCQPKTADGSVKTELPYFQAYTMDYSVNGTMESDNTKDDTSVMSIQGQNPGSDSTSSQAGATINTALLYKDSTGVACAAGTTDAGIDTGYRNGQPIPVRLCNIPNTTDESHGNNPAKVNSVVSGAFLAMIRALSQHLGVGSLRVADSYRSMADQEEAVSEYGLGRAAQPGYSNHQMGLAIDFQLSDNDGSTQPGDPTWDWLTANASKYGITQLPSESWHWQPIGADSTPGKTNVGMQPV